MAHIRGRVTERVDGDAAWTIIDRIFITHTGAPYPERADRVVFLIEPEHVQGAAFGQPSTGRGSRAAGRARIVQPAPVSLPLAPRLTMSP
jgi:hypothetical protein